VPELLTLEYIVENRASLLSQLNRRQGVMRDYVRMVVDGNATGVYIFGRPGTAKSYTVNEVLKTVPKAIAPQRGHVTPLGLFDLIEDNPDAIIPLDDVTAVLDSDVARQILLAALESPSPRDRTRTRIVTYRRHEEVRKAPFRGGITCISNKELHGDEVLEAFKSRVHVINYDPADAEMGARILEIAETGRLSNAHGVGPEERLEVARFVIGEMLRVGCRFELRLFVAKAMPIYRQWKAYRTESHWRDLVSASVEEHLVEMRHTPTRAEEMAADRDLVRALKREQLTRRDQIDAWVRLTGKSERAWYRRGGTRR
jgi:hypothetical protein